MDKEELRREMLYQATMNVARSMLIKGLITRDEYRQIDTKMTEKYKPTFGSLFSENELI